MSRRRLTIALSWRWTLIGALAVLYNDWLLALFLNPHISTARSFISEISAQTQPHHWVFRTTDIAAGVLTLAMLPLVWRLVRREPAWQGRLLALCFGLIGLDSIVDAWLPLTCAPSADLHCSLIRTQSITTRAHMVESLLIGLITFIAPLLWWFWHRRKHLLLARSSLWFAVTQAAVGLGIVATRAGGMNVAGSFQRVYQGAIGLWMALIVYAAYAHAAKRAKPARRQTETSELPLPEPTLQPQPVIASISEQ